MLYRLGGILTRPRCVVWSGISGKAALNSAAVLFSFLAWLRFRLLMVWLSLCGCRLACGSRC
nr:MAG TPA: hypothetical protein [Caudoviricetes sp.]